MGPSRKVLFAVIAAAVPAVVACNAIVGIDDFKRTECGPNPCPPPDSGPDQINPDNFIPDAPTDTRPDAPPGVGPVSWAAFKMPNYKVGVDASAPNPLNYEISGSSDEVTDKVTNRVWKRGVIQGAAIGLPGEEATEKDAEAKCKALNFGPWRLPKRIELVTLLSHGGGAPFIDTSIFDRVPSSFVWSSSEVRPFVGKYWAIDFGTGSLVQRDPSKLEYAKVLCVKDEP